MVQTRAGANRSEWLQFIAEMSKAYNERRRAANAVTEAPKEMPRPLKAPRRCRRGSASDPAVETPTGSAGTSCPVEP